MALSLPPLPQTRTLKKKEEKTSVINLKTPAQEALLSKYHGDRKEDAKWSAYINNISLLFVMNNKLRHWQPTVVGGRTQGKKMVAYLPLHS